MRKTHIIRLLSVILVLVLLCGLLPMQVFAAGTPAASETVKNDPKSAAALLGSPVQETAALMNEDTDSVRVSIVLSSSPTIARYSTSGIAANSGAMAYRSRLKNQQESVTSLIEKQALGGDSLDVVWNLTLAANIISANVEYGQIEKIEKVRGVKDVLVETRYEPCVVNRDETDDPSMATSSVMIGSTAAHLDGYTGAGTTIAVIDTGIDTNHQSFDAGAFEYSLKKQGLHPDLMTASDVAAKFSQLNIAEYAGSADGLYCSSKIPFGYNYVDHNLTIDHDHDGEGEHGSHVEGIAAANAWIPDGSGSYVSALDTVKVQGVAPDAQIITMKVFGAGGGAYDSDYMAAIEDAIVLGADAVNLSLGSGNPGDSTDPTYQDILDSLADSDTVVTISMGNSGTWSEQSNTPAGSLYNTDVSNQTGGSPGTYTNSLAVASVDNDGATGPYFTSSGRDIFYEDGSSAQNAPLITLAGQELDYVYIDGMGTDADMTALGDVISGKVFVCSRGSISFYVKANNAAAAGAAAAVIYNNTAGTISMNLTGYTGAAPCASILQSDGALLKANGEKKTTDGGYTYYTGKLTVASGVGSRSFNSSSYTMSSFSSWGVPGSLEMKPEITAPGGSIYSVNGLPADGKSYETMSGTSMAAPQVAGMAALAAQYVRENGLAEAEGQSVRTLCQSLLMSTATPLTDANNNYYDGYKGYYSVLQQGAGLANVSKAIAAQSYILMGEDATASYADGKVKAELGDDPEKAGVYTFSFSINNLTDESQSYNFSADLFTQDVFYYDVNSDKDQGFYLDTATAPLGADVTWQVDGQTLAAGATADFDGDGDTDSDDCDALLAYIAGTRSTINDRGMADYDADGSVTTHDAYLFLQDLGVTASVRPNASVTVTVTMTLSDETRGELDEYYPNGAYVEGYVYATMACTREGLAGVQHSIPMLAYYGDWTDPSMYEVGTRTAYAAGAETRTPYAGTETTNNVKIKYAELSGKYYFGGNPVFDDEPYQPERNAINSENGDRLDSVGFMLIRNAAAGRLAILKAGEDAPVYEEDLGAVGAAFYYTNGDAWYNTSNTQSLGWDMAGAEEGDSYTLSLSMATEYSVGADGTVDWDSLGSGAALSIPFVIDNTAPTMDSAVVSDDGADLTIKAHDNQYLAAAVLKQADGTGDPVTLHPEQSEAGETVTFVQEGLDDAVYILELYDYAMNCTTTRIFKNIEKDGTATSVTVTPATLRLVPGNTAKLKAAVLPVNVADDSVTWSTSNNDVATVSSTGLVTAVGAGDCTITAVSNQTNTVSGTCAVTVFSIDKDLDAVIMDETGVDCWSTFNTSELPDFTKGLVASGSPVSLTYGPGGTLYGANIGSSGTSTLYSYDSSRNATAVYTSTGFYADLAQSPTTGMLTAVTGDSLVVINPAGTPADIELGSVDLNTGETFVGIAYTGVDNTTVDNTTIDTFVLVAASGKLYSFGLDADSKVYFGSEPFFASGASTSTDHYCSAYYDGQYLFYSMFNPGANCSELYAMDVDSDVSAAWKLGSFGPSIWPVGGLIKLGTVNPLGADSVPGKLAESLATAKPVALSETALSPLPSGSVSGKLSSVSQELRAAQPQSASESVGKQTAMTGTVIYATAQDGIGTDVASYNGLLTVAYNAGELTLKSVSVHAAHYAVNDSEPGKVVIAYADLYPIEAGDPAATLVFDAANGSELFGTKVFVQHRESNNLLYGKRSETLTLGTDLCKHENLQHVEAKKATPTQDGNIEYWYCPDCGAYFADAACTREISKGDTIISAYGATITPVNPPVTDDDAFPFTDVSRNNWFYDDVRYVYGKSLMGSVSEGIFNPSGTLTRGMLATILYRLEGSPAASYVGTFGDVADGMWYAKGIEWAASHGIVLGYGGGRFGPNDPVTREQLAAILFRYAGYKSYDVSGRVSLLKFADSARISTYAETAMQWACSAGLVTGKTANTLDPAGYATRAQIAAVLHRFCELFAK